MYPKTGISFRSCFFFCLPVVTLLSLLPGKTFSELEWSIPHLDKGVHFGMYFILAVAAGLFFCAEFNFNTKVKWILILSLSGYGILLEVIQEYLVPNRYFDVWDILFNITGVLAGLLLSPVIKKYLELWNSIHKH